MASNLILVASVLSLVVLFCNSSPVSTDSPTAYDLLQGYNFPPGLLPKDVIHYDLDPSTGKWHAYLGKTCSFALEGSYQLKYRSTIGGTISNNKLKDLTGVSVRVLFLWLNIVEVTRVGDELEFSVGIASANFGIENFEVCPQCGCGLNCDGNPAFERAFHWPTNLSAGLMPGLCAFCPSLPAIDQCVKSPSSSRKLKLYRFWKGTKGY